MRILILAGVAAAALALTACNREEPAETTADGAMTAETGDLSADTSGGAMASGATGSRSGSMSGGSGSSGSTSGEAMPAVPPPENPDAPPVREGAKEKAESTNLHPPTN